MSAQHNNPFGFPRPGDHQHGVCHPCRGGCPGPDGHDASPSLESQNECCGAEDHLARIRPVAVRGWQLAAGGRPANLVPLQHITGREDIQFLVCQWSCSACSTTVCHAFDSARGRLKVLYTDLREQPPGMTNARSWSVRVSGGQWKQVCPWGGSFSSPAPGQSPLEGGVPRPAAAQPGTLRAARSGAA